MLRIFRRLRRRTRRRRGQGMTEYIIIVGLIAILLIAAVNALSEQLKKTYDAATKQVDEKVFKPISGSK